MIVRGAAERSDAGTMTKRPHKTRNGPFCVPFGPVNRFFLETVTLYAKYLAAKLYCNISVITKSAVCPKSWLFFFFFATLVILSLPFGGKVLCDPIEDKIEYRKALLFFFF